MSELIQLIYSKGFEASFGEAYRTPEQAALNAKNGIGIANSLHTKRLAIDLNLFSNGAYLNRSDDYKLFGEAWEKMGYKYGVQTRWGGRFKKADGNHFSVEHEGVAALDQEIAPIG